MDEDHASPLEWFLAMLAHTHACTAWYCQFPQREFLAGDRVADVVFGMHAFGTMHHRCAEVFRLHWYNRARAELN